VTGEEAKRKNIEYWLSSAAEALESARSEASAGRGRFAMNRVYYACFYSASAVLLHEDRHFVKHSGVRAAVHQSFVKPGRITSELGRFYDEAYRARQTADYGQDVTFDDQTILLAIAGAEEFLARMKQLLEERKSQ